MAARGNEEALSVLEGPPCPPVFEYLWTLYIDIAMGRSSGGMGPARLTWQDFYAWARLRRIKLTQFEVGVIFQIDRTEPKKWSTDDDGR